VEKTALNKVRYPPTNRSVVAQLISDIGVSAVYDIPIDTPLTYLFQR